MHSDFRDVNVAAPLKVAAVQNGQLPDLHISATLMLRLH